MSNRANLFTTVLVVMVGLCWACDRGPVEAASVGSVTAVEVPIGPIPGPGTAPPAATNPYEENDIALTQGRTLFVQYNCAGCHGGHAGGGMGPSLRDAAWIYGGSAAHIFSSIAEGRAHGMPSWGRLIPQDQIWKLVAYVKSLRTPREPSPPEI